jgi:hypothetical protein
MRTFSRGLVRSTTMTAVIVEALTAKFGKPD